MLTVFVLANNSAKALSRTLNALIGATVDGLVRDVVLLADRADQIAEKMADDTGCAVISHSDFSAAFLAAKGDWLLVLEAGSLPEQGWEEAVSNHIHSGGGAMRFKRSRLMPRTYFKQFFQAEPPLALGLLIEKRFALGLGENAFSSPQQLAHFARPGFMQAFLRPA